MNYSSILLYLCFSLALAFNYKAITLNAHNTCSGCRKDMHAGQFVYCDGSVPGSTVTNCHWVGGPGDCSFPRDTSVTKAQCEQLCNADDRCNYYTSYHGSICNLFYMTSCSNTYSQASGDTYEKVTSENTMIMTKTKNGQFHGTNAPIKYRYAYTDGTYSPYSAALVDPRLNEFQSGAVDLFYMAAPSKNTDKALQGVEMTIFGHDGWNFSEVKIFNSFHFCWKGTADIHPLTTASVVLPLNGDCSACS
mmetsp:Transcript_6742/g.7361  ORF Transcript_6742/g.7361 Transcript_6742/m.7361 type:complete len:249 (-) Transcript_6742:54-800(-)